MENTPGYFYGKQLGLIPLYAGIQGMMSDSGKV